MTDRNIDIKFSYDNGRGSVTNFHKVNGEYKYGNNEFEQLVNEFKLFLCSIGFPLSMIGKIPSEYKE